MRTKTAERFEVEWCSKVALVAGTEYLDFDRCEYSIRRFATLAEAKAFAEEVYPSTTNTIGVVTVTREEGSYEDQFDDGILRLVWNPDETSMHYSGEWED